MTKHSDNRSRRNISISTLTRALLDVLGPQLAPAIDPDALTCDEFALLYRNSIVLIEQRINKEGGLPPMPNIEAELLTRCLLTCRTLEEAIIYAGEFAQMIYPRAGRIYLQHEANNALIELDSCRDHYNVSTNLIDITGFLFFVQLFIWLTGVHFPYRIRTHYSFRQELAPFWALLGDTSYDDGPNTRIELEADLLELPIIRQASDLTDFILSVPYQIIPSELQPTLPQTRFGTQLSIYLTAAMDRNQTMPDIEDIARLMAVSVTTIRRRLREEGTSYIDIREQCRLNEATRLLGEPGWSIEQVATRLGFSEASAFRRAFKRWTGTNATAFRRR